MEKEIHRMELRKSDLERIKEQLMKELERAVEKRDTISIKGRANASNSKKIGGKLTEMQLAQKSKELRQSIADTDAECTAVDSRAETLELKRLHLAEQMQDLGSSCIELRQRDEQGRNAVADLLHDKLKKSLQSQALSNAAKMIENGKFDDNHSLAKQQSAVTHEHQKILNLLKTILQESPNVEADVKRIMLHSEAIHVL